MSDKTIEIQKYEPGTARTKNSVREGVGSILKPLTALKMLGEKPDTLDIPNQCRAAADRYRGFHVNDLDACIGCGTCAEICDNDAIRMVPVQGREADVGRSEYRPSIDYGRCCWCGLCVDVCTTNSLNMTTEYIHIDSETDSFFMFPDENGIHNKTFPLGWRADEDVNFLDLKRVEMDELPPDERADSFVEIVKGFSKEQAEKEATRCVACGICTATCPAAMNIPEYIDAIWKGDIDEAGRQMYKTNPLPDVCGRICTHKCETACSIGVRGEPISIRWLKRYAMDNIPAEEYPRLVDQKVVKPGNGRVAIVGGGPAGLSAAYYLVLMGYQVTIFEAHPKAGGMMRYGIPEYRLPYDALDKDIQLIEGLGVEIRTGTRVGTDVQMEQIRTEYDTVMIATGFHQGRSTRVPGTEHKMVFQAIDLLARVTNGEEFPVEEKIVVIGGGNVAMDIARSLARKQRQKYGTVNLVVTSLESRDIMPADEEEIIEAQEEGIVFHPGRGPEEILTERNSITGLKTTKCVRVFDDAGRFSPEFDKEDVEVYEASMVVEAIGQAPDMGYLGDLADTLEYDGRRIKVDRYYQSSEKWLFVVGDIIKGPDVINGVATGHTAALGIDYYLTHRDADDITRIDDVLRTARRFEQSEADQLEALIAAIPEGVDLEEAGGVAVTVVSAAERALEVSQDALDALDEILGNRNIRLHLRQELNRQQQERDFSRITRLERYPDADTATRIGGGGDDAVREAVTRLGGALQTHRREAYQLYSDILHLTRNKELEFTAERLRDLNGALVERVSGGVAIS
jgi:glutamate synthase (NADPH) small chain